MMTTFQLAQRLAQQLWGGDFARLDITQAEQLRAGVNLALDEFGSLLPTHRRKRQAPFLVESPQSISATVTEASTAISISTGFPISAILSTAADMAGRGVVLAGDVSVNRFVSSATLFQPWMQASGSVTGTVYSDGIAIPARIDQVAGTPLLVQSSGAALPALTHRQSEQSWNQNDTEVGTPREWWLEEIGGGDAVATQLLLRLWPLPSTRLRLVLPLLQFCAPVTMGDLHVDSRLLPVEEIEHGYLTAIAAEKLLTATGLSEKIDPAEIRTAADAARASLKRRANPSPSGQPTTVGTPRGF